MSDEQKTYTLAEVREKERKAFTDGARWHAAEVGIALSCSILEEDASKRYPVPTKPRVITENGPILREWKCEHHQIMVREHYLGGVPQWENARSMSFAVTPARIRMWADLLANPEEPADV